MFSALPQTAGAAVIGKLIDSNVRVVDLSADYRFDDVSVYERTYGVTHPRPDLNAQAVYGLYAVCKTRSAAAASVASK